MITPLDIQSIEFSKVVRGYKEEEVDAFLDELTKDLEAVLAERDALLMVKDELSAKLAEANAKNEKYKEQEESVVKTLEAAQALMSDISTSSEKRASILIANAELDAQNIRRQAEESLGVLKDEETRLIQRVSNFKARYKSLLESELDKFDDFSDELVGIPSSPSVRGARRAPVEETPDLDDDILIATRSKNDDPDRTIINVRGEA